ENAMYEIINSVSRNISIHHLNILFILGIALFGGTIGGRIFQKLHIPKVVGYIAIGILIGQSGLKLITIDTIHSLKPFNYFALGLIGFMIGGELKKEVIAKYGKQFIIILLSEGIGAFVAVTLFIGIIGSFIFENPIYGWALGMLLGAIASATAPAATAGVLWEYKARGPLTRIILGIVAMDDGLALLLFSIAAAVAKSLLGESSMGLFSTIATPFYEITLALIIGIISGITLNTIVKRYDDSEKILAFSIGTVLFVLGFSLAMDADMLIAAMVLGVTITNYIPRKSKQVFNLVEKFNPPIYVLFFVLVGAKLNIAHLSYTIILVGALYLIGRTAGKMIGAYLGAKISGAPKSVQKYLPLCLFSQAGVAIGLSILAGQKFDESIGNPIILIVTAATFIVEILGPPFVKIAVVKAGEAGLNITEEDILIQSKAEDIMDKNIPVIYENMHLAKILTIFGETDNLYYPVTDKDKKLLGIITIENLKDAFSVSDLSDFLLADDLMEPAIASASPRTPMLDVLEIMKQHNLEYLPIVSKDNTIVGLLENRTIQRHISRKILEMKKRTDTLEQSAS
ncbi:cation:proton antiporter, partial [bacterium]|nr:cation:proton antiporter [bacterium]